MSESAGPNDVVITFDLEQTLPTPKLSTGPAFYKRKLWTYNFNIHDCKQNVGHCFTWDESVAGRGSEEIGSCIKFYFESLNIRGNTLVAISDNCGGQNKNWNIQYLWIYLILSGRFNTMGDSKNDCKNCRQLAALATRV